MKKHPDLDRKFKLLYTLRLNHRVNNNAELSRALQVSRQAVGNWAKGTSTSLGDRIPDNKVEQVATVFGVPAYWLTLAYSDFETKVQEMMHAQVQNSAVVSPRRTSFIRPPPAVSYLIGRRQELATLDRAWNSTDTNVVQLLGFSGSGKTALIGGWLENLARSAYHGAIHVYTWSFSGHGQMPAADDGNDTSMIKHALEWFGDPQPAVGTARDRATRLARLIRARRTLFILDGLDTMQQPPGPAQGRLHCTVLALLLQELAIDMDGLCLLSSRQEIADLAPYMDTGNPLDNHSDQSQPSRNGQRGRVCTLTPMPLTPNASKRLLRRLGVKGSDSRFREAAQQHGGHPLNLRMLARHLTDSHRGHLLGLYQSPSQSSISSAAGESLFSHALDASRSYLEWFHGGAEQQLLHVLGLLERPLHFEELLSLARIEMPVADINDCLSQLDRADMQTVLNRLVAAGLVSLQAGEDCWAVCHPMLQGTIDLILKTEKPRQWQRLHELIFRHLCNRLLVADQPVPSKEFVFSAVRHGIKAGRVTEAFNLYFGCAKRRLPVLSRGSHQSDHACISLFFEREWDKPLFSAPPRTRSRMLSSAATNLMSLGRLQEVMEPTRMSIRQLAGSGLLVEAANVALPFVTTLIVAGELDESTTALNELNTMVGSDPWLGAACQTFAGFVAHLRGEAAEAALLFGNADRVLGGSGPASDSGIITFSAYHCRFLLETGQYHKAMQRALLTFRWRQRGSWQTTNDTVAIYARDLQVLGQACLALGEYEQAGDLLQRQLKLLQANGELLCLPRALAARASYFIETGELSSARADLDEALDTAISTGTRLAEWEGYLNLAALHLAGDDAPRGGDYLQKAQAMSGMGGFHFRDAEIHRMERQVLRFAGSLPYASTEATNPASFS